MNTTLSQAPANGAAETARRTRRPRFQIEHTDEAHHVRIELPGVLKENVRLNLEEGVIHLTAERGRTVPEHWKPLHRELSDAGYEFHLRLNDRVDESRLSAALDAGVLTLTLPVKEAVKPREIVIS